MQVHMIFRNHNATEGEILIAKPQIKNKESDGYYRVASLHADSPFTIRKHRTHTNMFYKKNSTKPNSDNDCHNKIKQNIYTC